MCAYVRMELDKMMAVAGQGKIAQAHQAHLSVFRPAEVLVRSMAGKRDMSHYTSTTRLFYRRSPTEENRLNKLINTELF